MSEADLKELEKVLEKIESLLGGAPTQMQGLPIFRKELQRLAAELRAAQPRAAFDELREKDGHQTSLRVAFTLVQNDEDEFVYDPWAPPSDLTWRLAHAIQAQPAGTYRRILSALQQGPKRWAELRPIVPGSSDNGLTDAVKRLVEADLVQKRPLLSEKAPTYQYELSEIGEKVVMRLEELRNVHSGKWYTLTVGRPEESAALRVPANLFVVLAKEGVRALQHRCDVENRPPSLVGRYAAPTGRPFSF